FNIIQDRDSFFTEIGHEFFNILNPVIDHKILSRGGKIFITLFEWTPLQIIDLLRSVGIPEFKARTILIDLESQMLGVPFLRLFRILGVKENTSDPSDPGWSIRRRI